MMPIEDLRSAIASGDAIAVVGTGVTLAATENNAVASWSGLLLHGLETVVSLHPAFESKASHIRHQVSSHDLDVVLAAAEIIARKLGSPDGGEFGRWLQASVGTLVPHRTDVLTAIAGLRIPLATTNYDLLLEGATGFQPITWLDHADVEQVIRGDLRAILHLHGHYRVPRSVVLGLRSYEKVINDPHATAVLDTLRTARTFVFIGCGDGLSDPNFRRLLDWSRNVFRPSTYRHYILAREAEVSALQAAHPLAEERVLAVAYGPKYSDLTPFLKSLQPGPALPPAPPPRLPSGLLGRDAMLAVLNHLASGATVESLLQKSRAADYFERFVRPVFQDAERVMFDYVALFRELIARLKNGTDIAAVIEFLEERRYQLLPVRMKLRAIAARSHHQDRSPQFERGIRGILRGACSLVEEGHTQMREYGWGDHTVLDLLYAWSEEPFEEHRQRYLDNARAQLRALERAWADVTAGYAEAMATQSSPIDQEQP